MWDLCVEQVVRQVHTTAHARQRRALNVFWKEKRSVREAQAWASRILILLLLLLLNNV